MDYVLTNEQGKVVMLIDSELLVSTKVAIEGPEGIYLHVPGAAYEPGDIALGEYVTAAAMARRVKVQLPIGGVGREY